LLRRRSARCKMIKRVSWDYNGGRNCRTYFDILSLGIENLFEKHLTIRIPHNRNLKFVNISKGI